MKEWTGSITKSHIEHDYFLLLLNTNKQHHRPDTLGSLLTDSLATSTQRHPFSAIQPYNNDATKREINVESNTVWGMYVNHYFTKFDWLSAFLSATRMHTHTHALQFGGQCWETWLSNLLVWRVMDGVRWY